MGNVLAEDVSSVARKTVSFVRSAETPVAGRLPSPHLIGQSPAFHRRCSGASGLAIEYSVSQLRKSSLFGITVFPYLFIVKSQPDLGGGTERYLRLPENGQAGWKDLEQASHYFQCRPQAA